MSGGKLDSEVFLVFISISVESCLFLCSVTPIRVHINGKIQFHFTVYWICRLEVVLIEVDQMGPLVWIHFLHSDICSLRMVSMERDHLLPISTNKVLEIFLRFISPQLQDHHIILFLSFYQISSWIAQDIVFARVR